MTPPQGSLASDRKPSHTPGPWKHSNDQDEIRNRIATVGWVEDYVIGVPFENDYETNYEDHGDPEADARLMAAAPDLLQALQWLLPGLELDLRYADPDDDLDCLRSRVKTIRDALEKALG